MSFGNIVFLPENDGFRIIFFWLLHIVRNCKWLKLWLDSQSHIIRPTLKELQASSRGGSYGSESLFY